MPEQADPVLAALLRATLEEPWDEWFAFTRLALADLLDERGLPGAAYLRALCPRELIAELAARRHYGSTGRGNAYRLCLALLHRFPEERDMVQRSCRVRALRLFPDRLLPWPCRGCRGTGRRGRGRCRACDGTGEHRISLDEMGPQDVDP